MKPLFKIDEVVTVDDPSIDGKVMINTIIQNQDENDKLIFRYKVLGSDNVLAEDVVQKIEPETIPEEPPLET